MYETCRLKTHCGHAASCPTRGSDEGHRQQSHVPMCVHRSQAPLPPAMWLEDMKEPASVSTWEGLASPGGQEKGQPCPHAQLTRAGRASLPTPAPMEVPRDGGRPVLGDLGFLPQAGNTQEPNSYFLGSGDVPLLQQSEGCISFKKNTSTFLVQKFSNKKNLMSP